MALTLQTILPPTRSGRTFFVAASLLGLGALIQLALMAVFLLRGGVVRHQAPPPIPFAETVQPTMSVADSPARPTIAEPAPALPVAQVDRQPSSLAPGNAAPPTPAPAFPAVGAAAGMIEQARQLRQRGDMPSALARLREAQVTEPENPQIIAEMALTYETMQLGDRAFEQWQRLYKMGESIGALYYLADSRLHAAPATPPPNASDAMAGRANNQLPFQENTVLKITDIHLEEVPDPNAERKLVLKIVVKDRPGSAIDPTKVRILTYFYDLLDGKDVVLTDAETDYAWVTQPPINWAGDKSEVLETTYLRPRVAPTAPPSAGSPAATPARGSRRNARSGKKDDAPDGTPPPAASATPAPVRAYLGYVVRLYYDRQLQDVQADPVRLLQQFPPPLTLPVE